MRPFDLVWAGPFERNATSLSVGRSHGVCGAELRSHISTKLIFLNVLEASFSARALTTNLYSTSEMELGECRVPDIRAIRLAPTTCWLRNGVSFPYEEAELLHVLMCDRLCHRFPKWFLPPKTRGSFVQDALEMDCDPSHWDGKLVYLRAQMTIR